MTHAGPGLSRRSAERGENGRLNKRYATLYNNTVFWYAERVYPAMQCDVGPGVGCGGLRGIVKRVRYAERGSSREAKGPGRGCGLSCLNRLLH